MPYFTKDGRGKGGQTAKSKVKINLPLIKSNIYQTPEDSDRKGVFDIIYDQIAELGSTDEVPLGSDIDKRLHEIESALCRQDSIILTKDDHPDVIRAFKSCMSHYSKAEQEGLKKIQRTMDKCL